MERHRCHEPRRESGHARYAADGLFPIPVRAAGRRPAANQTASGNSIAGNAENGTGRTNATSKPSICPRKSSASRIPLSPYRKAHRRSSQSVAPTWRCPKMSLSKQPARNFWSFWITSSSKSSTERREYRHLSPPNGLDDFKRHEINNLLNKFMIFTD